MKLIVTGSQSLKKESDILKQFIKETNIEYIPRARKSLPALARENGASGVIVWYETGPILYIGEEKFFFHPSMAKNRLILYRKNQIEDNLIKASGLESQDSFLDCTLGMGADAIVASYFTSRPVLSLESSYPISIIIKWGMKTYQTKASWLIEPLKKIEICHADHGGFLHSLNDGSYDIVYFDPMFERPLLSSKPLNILRKMANHNPLTRETIAEACRVARKKVVMKERVDGNGFSRLGFHKIAHSPHNRIGYGIITV